MYRLLCYRYRGLKILYQLHRCRYRGTKNVLVTLLSILTVNNSIASRYVTVTVLLHKDSKSFSQQTNFFKSRNIFYIQFYVQLATMASNFFAKNNSPQAKCNDSIMTVINSLSRIVTSYSTYALNVQNQSLCITSLLVLSKI